MSTDAITSTTGTNSTNANSMVNAQTKTLGQDAFLKLLITEMQNQDPLNPMDNKDSIAQLAQFTSLQQMQQLNTSFTNFGNTFANSSSATQAYSLTGNWVDYKDPNNPDAVLTGRVENVSFENGTPKLKVGASTIDLASITKVYPSYASVGQGRTSTQAISMIGSNVNYVDSQTGEVKNGKVDGVTFVNGWPKLTIGSSSVDFGNILGVSESANPIGDSDLQAMANSMAGKWVEYSTSGGATSKGLVKSVSTTNGGIPQLMVNGALVDISNVIKVYKPS